MNDDLEVNTDTPNLQNMAESVVSELLKLENLEKAERMLTNGLTEALKIVFTGFTIALSEAVGPIVEGILQGEAASEGSYARVAAGALSAMFKVSINPSDVRPFGRGNMEGAARAIGDAVLRGMADTTGEITPSDANAKKYIGSMVNIGVEGWLNGFIFEIMSGIESFGLAECEKFGELKDVMIEVLGLSRLSRRVLGPYVNTLIVQPFKWHLNKTYRPELLGASLLARDLARGRRTRAQCNEELARQGFSEDRIESMMSDSRKRLGVSDVLYLHREWNYQPDWMKAQLKDLGYDDETIQLLVDVENAKRYRSHMEDAAAAAAAGYISGALDEADLLSTFSSVYQDAEERQLVLNVIDLKKKAQRRRLTDADAREAVLRGIWSAIDYRRYLKDEGYNDDDAIVKELLLKSTIQERDAAARERARIEKEKADALAKKKADDERRRLELEAQHRAIGPGLDDIKHAFIRGLIPIGRYEEALSSQKLDAGDVAFLVSELVADRAEYVKRQKKLEQAEIEGAIRHVSTGDLAAAVLAGVLSLGDYSARLSVAGFAADDVALLAGVMRDKLDDQAAANAMKEAAAAALVDKPVPLAAAERAVIRGAWSFGQYEDLLRSSGFNAGAVATLSQLLRDQVDELAAAERRRRQIEAEKSVRSATIGDLEQSVIRGLTPLSTYDVYLARNGYSLGDQTLLTTLLKSKADDAAAARAVRVDVEQKQAHKPLNLAQIERAVMLGTVSLDAYRSWLAGDGYADGTIEVLVSNLTLELQAKRAAEQKRAAAEAAAAARGVSLAQAEAAVVAGVWTLERFTAWLREQGFAPDATDTIVALLVDKLAAGVDARALAAAVDDTLHTRELSLSQWEAAVKADLRTLEDYGAFLVEQGFALADAQILVELLARKLDAAGGAAATGGPPS